MVISAGRMILGVYIFFVFVVLPLMSPLRALGVMEPALIRNAVLPPLLFLLILAFGVGHLIRPKTYLHIILLAMFFLAAVIGLGNLGGESGARAYFSHLFQVGSAYVMVGVGWLAYDRLNEKYWKRLVVLALFSALVSTAATIRALGEGEIGRFYTPAYGFILIYAFGAVCSTKTSILAFFGSVISNKRGVIISIVIMLLAKVVISVRTKGVSRKSMLKGSFLGVVSLLVIGVGSASLVGWASLPMNRDVALAQAVNITYERMKETIQPSGDRTLNQVSAGRIDEIQLTLDSLTGVDYLLGSGAGWGLELLGGREVQNIHFTPLSLVAVFGSPAAIALYCFLGVLAGRGILRQDSRYLNITERMAPLYLVGALVHSLVAYSLFIDWMVFFFAGVLVRSLRVRNNLKAGIL